MQRKLPIEEKKSEKKRRGVREESEECEKKRERGDAREVREDGREVFFLGERGTRL